MKRKSTKKWLERAMVRRKDPTRPLLAHAYSDNGHRLIAADGYQAFIEDTGTYYPETFYDGENPLPVYGKFPDVNSILPRLNAIESFDVDSKTLWSALKTLTTGLKRSEGFPTVRMTLSAKTLALTVTRIDETTKEKRVTELYVKVYANPSRNDVQKTIINLWYLHDAVEGLKHNERISVRLHPSNPNVFQTTDRTALIMPCQDNR